MDKRKRDRGVGWMAVFGLLNVQSIGNHALALNDSNKWCPKSSNVVSEANRKELKMQHFDNKKNNTKP